LDNFKEKLSINNFSVDDSLFSFKTPLENKLQEIKNIYQEKRAKQSAYQDQKRGVESQLFSLQKDESENKLKLDQISKKLGEINPEILANLKEKKKNIQDEQELIESNAETEKCELFYNEYKDKLSLQ
jgi:chromosome segregation ATPase